VVRQRHAADPSRQRSASPHEHVLSQHGSEHRWIRPLAARRARLRVPHSEIERGHCSGSRLRFRGILLFLDCPFNNLTNVNRAGFRYQGEYWARTWARTTFGYEFEDENGFIGDPTDP